MPPPPRPPLRTLFAALRAHPPSAPAITDALGVHTYAALLRRAARLRTLLPPAPVEPDPSRVAILTAPTSLFAASLLAVWSLPAAAVPLSPLHPRPALHALLADADPLAVLVDRPSLPLLPPGPLPPILLDPHHAPDPHPHRDAPYTRLCDSLAAPTALTPRDAAILIFTSGTTARPKGVVWRHAMLHFQLRTLAAAWRFSPADRLLNVLPLHHIHGLVNVLLLTLHVGAHVEMLPSFSPSSVWHIFTRPAHATPPPPTVFMAVPAVYARLIRAYNRAPPARQAAMRAGAARLRLFVCGSASLSRQDYAAWERISGHRILERYGMTETGMTLSNRYEHRQQVLLGYPLPGVEARVQTDSDSEDHGQLLVRSPGVFREYWRRPDATREAFTEDGWFRTGDVVRCVPDRYGAAFTMMGRASSDIIKTGGYKVSALEIEQVLRDCVGVRDCCVIGLENEILGEEIVAALIAADGADGDEVAEAAKDWAMKNLPKYQVPRRFVVVEDFPRNVLGKVQKQVFKASLK